MKKIGWLLIMVLFLSAVMSGFNLPGSLALAADTLRVAKITAIQGDVKVLRAGGEKNFPAFKGMGLTQGDTVITGKDGRATLELADDKELKIGENSRVMISELVKSLEDNTDKISLNLKAGQVYTNVKGKLSPSAKYEIRTPTAVMGVRGTQFFVNLASGGQAKVVTLEGNVFVTVPQLVTLADGITVTRDVEIEVQPNQIFVQTGDIIDPGRYDLEALTGDEELSLFVLETLQEISVQQPDLINPEILQNLEERIERAREEQLEQQRQIERQQEELVQSIQYDAGTGSVSPPTGDSGGGSGGPPATNPGDDEDLPEIIIITELEDVYLRLNDELSWMYHIETDPADDVELEVEVEDEDIAEASFDGNDLYIWGLKPGSTRVTVKASKDGYRPAEVSFTVIVYEEYEEGDWVKSIIDEDGEISHTDIALDRRGMPHIIYDTYDIIDDTYEIKYRHWNGNSWQEEECNVYGKQGSLTILPDSDGNDYSLISCNSGGELIPDNSGWELEYDVFDGRNWHYLYFGNEGVSVGASSNNVILYYNDYWKQMRYGAGISYYDEANGDLYFRFNKYPMGNNHSEWSFPFRVDGEYSDAGKSSSLAFGPDGKAYIAYYDYSDDRETGSLKLAVIGFDVSDNPVNPELLGIIVVDKEVGYEEGQYVSLAVDEESSMLHLAYYDANNKELKYARGFGEVWSIETVDNSSNDVGKYASLALDNEGNPHISYYAKNEAEGGALKYARRNPDNYNEWLIEVIEEGEEVGLYSSIAWDDNLSVPHFAYIARIGEGYAVKHATRKGIMNAIEPNFLSGTMGEFENEVFHIENSGNKISYVQGDIYIEEEYDRELVSLEEGEDYYLSEDDEGIIFTLTRGFLNSLGISEYEEPHRIWVYFDNSLPVCINVEVTKNMEAYIHRYNPDVAYDPINNRYLMVYKRGIVEDIYSEIWGRFISAGGVLSPEFPISEDRRCYEPKVVYNPENETFLVVWSDDRYYEGGLIYAQILDKEGNLYGDKGNFAVCPTTGPDSGQDRPAVAVTSNGNYLIAWEECVSDDDLYLEIYGQLLDQEGEPVGEKLTLVSKKWDQSDPVLAYSGGKYFMAFVDKNYTYDNTIINILGLYIGADGLPKEEFLTIAFDLDWIVELDVVADNGRIFVVWEDWRDDWTGKIYGRFINAGGIMEDEFRVYQSDISQCAPSVTLNTKNGGFLVAWKDYQGRLYAKHFTAEGSGLGEPVQINPEGEEPENVKVAYNSEENNYLAVYEKYGEGPTCIGITILSVPEEGSEPSGELLEIQEQPLAAGATHSLVVMDG